MLGFQRLDVYRCAVRFFGIARGSALECAAVLDAVEALGLVPGASLIDERDLLERIVSMLTKMRPAAR